METSELIGPALDWAVSRCEGIKLLPVPQGGIMEIHFSEPDGCTAYQPSTNWAQGGPITEREGIKLYRGQTGAWWSATESDPHYPVTGPTPLIAAMRCYVIGILGDEIEVPEELL